MSKAGDRQLYRELRDWRKNKTENYRLTETHDLFDRQLATRRKSHDKEVQQLSQQLMGVKVKKPTPSVDEHLGKSYRRNENFRAAERANFDRRYKAICSSNTRSFKKLHSSSHLPPEILNQIVTNPGSRSARRSAGKKTAASEDKPNTPDTPDESNEKTVDDKSKDNNENKKNNGSDTEQDENNEDQDEDEIEEPPEWYIGRRRFTLAALNEPPSHLTDSRRQSTGSLDLAAILEVAQARNTVRAAQEDTLHEVNESIDSEKDRNSDGEDDDVDKHEQEENSDCKDNTLKDETLSEGP